MLEESRHRVPRHQHETGRVDQLILGELTILSRDDEGRRGEDTDRALGGFVQLFLDLTSGDGDLRQHACRRLDIGVVGTGADQIAQPCIGKAGELWHLVGVGELLYCRDIGERVDLAGGGALEHLLRAVAEGQRRPYHTDDATGPGGDAEVDPGEVAVKGHLALEHLTPGGRLVVEVLPDLPIDRDADPGPLALVRRTGDCHIGDTAQLLAHTAGVVVGDALQRVLAPAGEWLIECVCRHLDQILPIAGVTIVVEGEEGGVDTIVHRLITEEEALRAVHLRQVLSLYTAKLLTGDPSNVAVVGADIHPIVLRSGVRGL